MGSSRAATVNPENIRNQMLRDMPIQQFEQMMSTAQSRSSEMWEQSRAAMDPDSEMNQRMKENIMGQNQDMIATQMRMASSNAARGGMAGSGIAAAQQAAMGLQGQQQGLMAVQSGLDQQQRQGMGLLQASQGFAAQGMQAGQGLGQMIGGANQGAVNAINQNVANRNSMKQSRNMMIGGAFSGMFGGLSDRRVKKDVKKIGENSQGYNIFEFKYIPPYQDVTDDTVYVGVMADEVHEGAKFMKDGIYHVDYKQIDLKGFI